MRGVGRTFAHIEHARWATFLDYAGIDWAYQPALLGVTVDMVLKPAFRLGCGMWLHLCSRVPNNSTRIASLIVSRDTGSAVGIICGEMFAPHPERSPVSPLMLFMPDAGITLERYWGGRHRCISPRSPDTQYHDIFSSDVRRAFSLALDARFSPL